MKFNKLGLFALSAATLLAVACGDNVTEVTNVTSGIPQLEKGKDLGKCSDENMGEMFFVVDSSAVYFCADGKWNLLKGEDGKNGKDGEDGKDGKDGKNSVDTVFIVKDTLVIKEPIVQKDTLVVRDTVYSSDTIYSKDTIYSFDTLFVTQRIPSVKYDCSQYNCVTTAYLNPSIEYGELLDERDNRVYRTVQIGDQVWMAQNLAYDDPDDIALQGQSWCYYDSTDFCETFGRLYSWSAAMNFGSTYNSQAVPAGSIKEPHRGICPEGFHVPTRAEWVEVIDFAESNNGAERSGTSLKSQYLWASADSAVLGTDRYGLSLLPGNDRIAGRTSKVVTNTKGYDEGIFLHGLWWTASEASSTATHYIGLSYYPTVAKFYLGSIARTSGFSLRCVQDKSP